MSYGDTSIEDSFLLVVTCLHLYILSTSILVERNWPVSMGEVSVSQIVLSIDWFEDGDKLVQQELGRQETLRVLPSVAQLLIEGELQGDTGIIED